MHHAVAQDNSHYLRQSLLSIVIAAVSTAALVYLTYLLPPEGLPLALFFLLLFCGVAGLFAPLMLWVHRRLVMSRHLPASVWRPFRWSAWAGLLAAILAWLQFIRLLNVVSAVLFFLIFSLLEWLITSKRQ
ncbi:MAG: hypothetical protein ACP5TV_04085 [Anaerolineae bacterium]